MTDIDENSFNIAEQRNQMKKAYFETPANAYKQAVSSGDYKAIEAAESAIIAAMVMGYTPRNCDIDPSVRPVVKHFEPAVREVEWTDDANTRKVQMVREMMAGHVRE